MNPPGSATVVAGRLLDADGARDGALLLRDGRIVEAGPRPEPERVDHDFGDDWILPGFIDPHIHGAGSSEFVDVDGLVDGARRLAAWGVAAFCPTAVSADNPALAAAGQALAAARRITERARTDFLLSGGRRGFPAARILGWHYEGPFLNPERVGGIPPATLRPASAAAARDWLAAAGAAPALMTWAPEIPGGLEAGRVLADAGVALALGHCRAGAEDVRRAVACGARSVTHLHNTWPRPAECDRDPGVAAALAAVCAAPELVVTAIPDLLHVAPDRLAALLRRLPPERFAAMTDAMTGTGLPPGAHQTRDGRSYTTDGQAARLDNGTLVGSVLTMPDAFRNLTTVAGMTPAVAARQTSANAARLLGLRDLGALHPGHAADLAVMTPDGRLRAVIHGGLRWPSTAGGKTVSSAPGA